MHGRAALAIHPAAINGKYRPRAVVLQSAAWTNARLAHIDRVERLDGMQPDAGQARLRYVGLTVGRHGFSLADQFRRESRITQTVFRGRLPVSRENPPARDKIPSANATMLWPTMKALLSWFASMR